MRSDTRGSAQPNVSTPATTPNRKERRARKPRPTIREQRLASLMHRIHMDGLLRQGEREAEPDYFRRIRRAALRVQHEQRKARRTASRAARKANR